MHRDELTNEYHEKLRNNERELEELDRQMRKLEEKEQCLFEWKRQDIACLDQLHLELQHEDSIADRHTIENLIDETQHICRNAAQILKKEHDDIEQSRKRLYAEKEQYHSDYQHALRKLEEDEEHCYE